MNASRNTGSVVSERMLPFGPEAVWRALTTSASMDGWLMKNDFEPVVGRRFSLRAGPATPRGAVVNGLVLIADPCEQLAYRWTSVAEDGGAGLNTIVTWTLVAEDGGTRLRMEQAGFGPGDDASRRGAEHGWRTRFAALEENLAEAA